MHTPSEELRIVLQELKTIIWAEALLQCVYVTIKQKINEKGNPDFEIPQLRFVKAALLMDQRNSGGAYITEEFIQGDFCKYLDNRSCISFEDLNHDQKYIADFLTSVQHSLWYATQHTILITDFQGISSYFTLLYWLC